MMNPIRWSIFQKWCNQEQSEALEFHRAFHKQIIEQPGVEDAFKAGFQGGYMKALKTLELHDHVKVVR